MLAHHCDREGHPPFQFRRDSEIVFHLQGFLSPPFPLSRPSRLHSWLHFENANETSTWKPDHPVELYSLSSLPKLRGQMIQLRCLHSPRRTLGPRPVCGPVRPPRSLVASMSPSWLPLASRRHLTPWACWPPGTVLSPVPRASVLL